MKKLFTLFALFLGFQMAYGQYAYVTVPSLFTGTSASYRGPASNINAQRSSAVYAASEFTGLLSAGDTIFRFGYSINTVPTGYSPVTGTLRVLICNTSDATFLRSTTWSTLVTTPTQMDTVYNGPLTIPAAVGPYAITLTKPFVYSGGGIYVAFEWSLPTTSTLGIVYNCNTAITSAQRNAQGTTLSTLTTLSNASNFRPQIYLGKKMPVNDASIVEVYSLGKLPIPFAAPHAVKARVKNGGSDTLYSKSFYLNVGPVNSFQDSVVIDTLLPAQEKTIQFNGYTPTTIGMDTVKVYCGPDTDNGNNLKKYGQVVNYNTYNYADPLRPANGGVGFTGGTGDFVAKFPYVGSNSINQIGVNFNTGGNTLKVGIWDTSALGSPGTLLWSSAPFLSVAGLNTIPVNPPVAIGGSFFVGVIQTGTVNAAFSYQNEAPIRGQTFYYTAPTGGTTWTDFLTTASNFRFMIEPRLQMANDIGTTEISQPCDIIPFGMGGIAPKARIYNYGSNTQFAPLVKAYIYDASNSIVCRDSVPVTFILPGTSQDVNFASIFTPTIAGTYTVKIWTELTGDADPNNDTASKTFQVLAPAPGTSGGTRLQFDAVDDYISINHSASMTPGREFTLEMWVRPSSSIAVGSLYSKDSTVSDTSLSLSLSGLTPQVTIRTDSGYYNILSSINTVLLSWSHIAVTYNGSALKLYVNGEKGIDTVLNGSVTSRMGPVYLGRRAGASNAFNGGMENFIFRNTARTQTQIKLGLHRKLAPLSDPTVMCYLPFDENGGNGPLCDASGNCNNGTMNNFTAANAWFISSLPLDTTNGVSVVFNSNTLQSFTGKKLALNFVNLSAPQEVVAHYITGLPLGFLPDTVISTTPKYSHNNYWILYRYGTANTYDTLKATFTLNPGNIGATTALNSFYLASRDNAASGVWDLVANPADAVNVAAQTLSFRLPQTNAFTRMYGLASSASSSQLPVNYLFFKGTRSDREALLNWATATETNADYFILERSNNSSRFVEAGKVDAAGNSQVRQDYQFADPSAFAEGTTAWYRLKLVDLDGSSSYSEVIRIDLDPELAGIIQSVQPNPYSADLILSLQYQQDLHASVEMTNINGQVVFTRNLNLETGQNRVILGEAANLPAGIYFLRLAHDGRTETVKVVKMR